MEAKNLNRGKKETSSNLTEKEKQYKYLNIQS